MNKNPITEETRTRLKAEHRERVRRCTVDVQKMYADRAAEAARVQKELDEEEWANEGGAGGDGI